MKTKCFNLINVIAIIIVTSIISALTTGVIMMNNNKINISRLTSDEDLRDFIEVYEVVLSKYYDDIDKKAMLEAAEDGMLNFLGDKYTTYLEDSEYQEIMDELSASYQGIGVEIKGNMVISVVANSPAEKAGIKAGDYITKINDVETTNKTASEVSALIKNNKSKSIDLEINRDDEILHFTLNKETLANKAINYKIIEETNIGYIYIRNFAENLDEQVKNALKDLESQDISSLIIDVRDDAGGYLSAAESTSSLFLEKGKTIYSLQNTSNGKVKETVVQDETSEKRNYPIVVLIDSNTASAAEILAAALKESYGAILVGTKSFGKGKVQEVVSLDNGDSVKATSAKWLTPNGDCIDGIGLIPNYVVGYSINGLYNDTQLAKAIELLNK